MYCSACGQQLDQTEAFCHMCGTAVLPPVQGSIAVPQHSAVGIASFAVGVVALALAIAHLSGLTASIWVGNALGWALLAAVLAFGLGFIGASLKKRNRRYAALGMHLAIVTLGIQALSHFVWILVAL